MRRLLGGSGPLLLLVGQRGGARGWQFLGRFNSRVLLSGGLRQGMPGFPLQLRGGNCVLFHGGAAIKLVEHAIGGDLQVPPGMREVLELRYDILEPPVP